MSLQRAIGVPGRPFEAVLNSADADPALALVLYEPGTTTVITLDSREYLTIVWAKLVTAAGGDAYLFVGPDNSLGTNETIVRGTYATNGGFAGNLDIPKQGAAGAGLWCFAAAGAVDALVRGTIRQKDSVGVRPSWREGQPVSPAV